jgi:uncharacterized oligopeptide transporter (OPT) family protein
MTILENNCMQSTASSASYSTGSTLVSAFSAFIMLNGHALPVPLTLAWVFFLAILGVTMAVPMKKQMINIEQLRFPSGVAAAETLRALYSHGARGMRAAKALGVAGVLAAIDNFIHDGFAAIPRLVPFSTDTLCTKLNEHVFGRVWMGRTVEFSWEPIFIASGAIMGLRVCASILVGGVVCWMLLCAMGAVAWGLLHDLCQSAGIGPEMAHYGAGLQGPRQNLFPQQQIARRNGGHRNADVLVCGRPAHLAHCARLAGP